LRRTIDLRLALPSACAWAALALALDWPRRWCLGLGLVGAAAGGIGLMRAGRRPALIAVSLGALVTGLVLAGAGAQALAWERTELVKAARAEERVDLVLRLTEPAKARASPWGGADSVRAVGVAWPVSPEAVAGAGSGAALEAQLEGRGVPTLAYFDGPPPAAGALVRLRARLALAEPGAAQRLVATAIGTAAVSQPTGWRGLVYRLRAGLNTRASPLLAGIALGDTSRIDAKLDADLKTTSLTHITAVSGAHVAIVLGAVLGVGALAGAPRWLMGALGVATLAAFVALIGPGPSVWRAVAMGLAAVAGIAFGKTRLALGALAAAVLAVLLADPWLARSYGLLLSVLATAALIVLAPPLALAMRRRWPRLPAALAEATALTSSAQLVCAPVIVIFAGQISLTALPANLLAAPAVPVATISALISVGMAPLSGAVAGVGAAVGNVAAAHIGGVATWVAGWPLAAIAWPTGVGGFAAAVAATAALGAAVWWLRRRGGRVRVAMAALAAAAVVAAVGVGAARGPLGAVLGRGPPEDWAAAVCDVGQGTAVAVRTGTDSAILVDAGPRGGGVGACLAELGVERLDVVVLTHFHADHVGGLSEALDGRAVGEVVHGPPCGQAAGPTLAAAEAAGGVLRRVDQAEPLSGQAGGAKLTIYPSALAALCPDEASDGEDQAANNAGLAVLAETDGLAVWALGDLEVEGQAALLSALAASAAPDGSVPGKGGLVVVAHHGSASQSEALAEALAARVAVMSAGEGNAYGHPSQAALDLYSRFGEVKRTDQSGTVVESPP
jgi:competence protein ComEC